MFFSHNILHLFVNGENIIYKKAQQRLKKQPWIFTNNIRAAPSIIENSTKDIRAEFSTIQQENRGY